MTQKIMSVAHLHLSNHTALDGVFHWHKFKMMISPMFFHFFKILFLWDVRDDVCVCVAQGGGGGGRGG